jgi:DNA-binding GntR family transcriptional regulator
MDAADLRPQERLPDALVDRATDVLREAIVTGQLVPGSPLVQEQLATELGISRTPLREALRRLEQEGLVAVRAKRGLAVAELSPEALVDTYDVREVLDGLAARLAAERISPGELAELRVIHERSLDHIESWDPEGWMAANARFHAAILRAGHSPALQRAMPAGRMSGLLLFPGLFLHPKHVETAYEEHGAVFDAIHEHNPDAAEAAARRHIERVSRAVRDEMRKRNNDPRRNHLRPLKQIDDRHAS